MESGYPYRAVEQKWIERWEREKAYQPDLATAKRPFYNLMMFPYPSAEGLHVGNLFAFVGSDIQGRFRKAQGFDLFEPMGFDAFGMHSENYALKVGEHPRHMIPRNIERFREKQLKRLGNMFDWSHELDTTDPSYYRWTQWIFLKLYEANLAYRKSGDVNWCPSCKTVLANEQVEGGQCERCDAPVGKRSMEQWFLRITAYAQRLLDNLDWIDWSETTKKIQKNWIGRSDGTLLLFDVEESQRRIEVFTTRPDTLWGVTFLVLPPEHPLVGELTKQGQRRQMEPYLRDSAATGRLMKEVEEKTGVFSGSYAIHPATGSRIPIWVSDYVLASYGTGAIMAVPAHDERDFQFARTFDLPVVPVIAPEGGSTDPSGLDAAYTGEGVLLNSGPFDGVPSGEAKIRITRWLADHGRGKAKVSYRLRDWCISRQRYWGPPIPIIHCDLCGTVPVPEEELPVLLPLLDQYEPDGSGTSPLARDPAFVKTSCPQCGGAARRETDVSDNFLDSAWYFLRYPSSDCNERAFDEALTRKWLPVDTYVGGNEHAVRHLLYTRFITMALYDMGLIGFSEPFEKFRAHGLLVKDGMKMSKSKGNVINPDHYLENYGADVFRTYLMFAGDYQQGGNFRDKNIAGVQRFLDRLWRYATKTDFSDDPVAGEMLSLMHRKIKRVTDDVERLHYNTAIASIMALLQAMMGRSTHHRQCIAVLLKLLAPFAPFITQELWQRLGGQGQLCKQSWPQYEESLLRQEQVEIVLQVNGRIRDRARLPFDMPQRDVERIAFRSHRLRLHLEGKTVEKIVFVQNRLLNIVVEPTAS
jgi:leucyl-tRNA synthetase